MYKIEFIPTGHTFELPDITAEELKEKLDEEYIYSSEYPVDAVNWIKQNLDISKLKIYNEYNYGSYLIYQDIPVFIDSRADLYAPEFNNKNNIDIITNDHMPFIGEIQDNLYLGTGYNTWGMTNSVLSGKIVSDLILNKKNKYIKLFDPKRSKKKIRMISDSFSTLKGYYEGFTNKNSKVKYSKINGVDVIKEDSYLKVKEDGEWKGEKNETVQKARSLDIPHKI